MNKYIKTFKKLKLPTQIAVVGGLIGIFATIFNWTSNFIPINNVLILTEIQSSANGLADYRDKNFFTVGLNKTVNFALSAPSKNEDIIVVDNIELEVIDFQKFIITHFPEGPKSVPTRYNEKIKILPKIKKYSLFSDSTFYYKPGSELERFIIYPESDENYLYKIKVNIEYYSVDKPNNKEFISSPIYTIGNAKRIKLSSILNNATKIDFFLNHSYAIEGFIESNIPQRTSDFGFGYPSSSSSNIYDVSFKPENARFVFCPQSDLHNQLGRDLSSILFNYQISYQTFNVVPNSLFSRTSMINPSFINNSNQFILVNDSLVIQHILTDRAQIFTDKQIVKKYIEHFNNCFSSNSKIRLQSRTKNWELTKPGNYLVIWMGGDISKTGIVFNKLSADLYPKLQYSFWKKGKKIIESLKDTPDITISFKTNKEIPFSIKSKGNKLYNFKTFDSSIDAENYYFNLKFLSDTINRGLCKT